MAMFFKLGRLCVASDMRTYGLVPSIGVSQRGTKVTVVNSEARSVLMDQEPTRTCSLYSQKKGNALRE